MAKVSNILPWRTTICDAYTITFKWHFAVLSQKNQLKLWLSGKIDAQCIYNFPPDWEQLQWPWSRWMHPTVPRWYRECLSACCVQKEIVCINVVSSVLFCLAYLVIFRTKYGQTLSPALCHLLATFNNNRLHVWTVCVKTCTRFAN